MRIITSAEEFDRLREGKSDPRFLSDGNPYFTEEEFETMLDYLRHLYIDANSRSMRHFVRQFLIGYPQVTQRTVNGEPVTFHTVDTQFEKKYIAIFGAISAHVNKAPRPKRRTACAPLVRMDWSGEYGWGALLKTIMIRKGMGYTAREYAALFNATYKSITGEDVPNMKGLLDRVTRTRHEIETERNAPLEPLEGSVRDMLLSLLKQPEDEGTPLM